MPRPQGTRPHRPENIFLGIAVLAGICWAVDRAFVQPTKFDAVQRVQDQYLSTKQGGSSEDLCGQAGQVKEAYSRADDDNESEGWKSVQRSDCEAAGKPQR